MQVQIRGVARVVLVSVVALCPFPAFAQAWVGAPGSLSLSVKYDYLHANHHVMKEEFAKIEPTTGRTRYVYSLGTVYTHLVTPSVEYAAPFLDGLALQVRLPISMTDYEGLTPHEVADADGHFHPTIDGAPGYYKTPVDFYGEARYMMQLGSFALTPLVGVIYPSRDYETFGHAAPGRGLKGVALGLNLGYRPESLPEVYANLRYAFELTEPIVLDSPNCTPCSRVYNMNLSTANATVGYFLSDEVSLNASLVMSYRHDGIDEGDEAFLDADFVGENAIHDQLYQEFVVHGILGVSLMLTESLSLDGSYMAFLTGYNTHDAKGVSVGFTYSFEPSSGDEE